MPELLPLPISPRTLQSLISQAAWLLPPNWDTKKARAAVTAICLQESALLYRRQMGNGPAKGLAQFERGGGVKGVLTHAASRVLAKSVCEARGVEPTPDAVWNALEFDDVLALAFARLLLYTDPKPLPEAIPENHDESWAVYQRNWRPGKPHPETWIDNWGLALEAVNPEDA